MLYRKAARAIWANKKAYLACVFLIAVGVMIYTALNIASDGLETSMARFYKDYRLADVFAKVDAMPASAADIFLDIEGVEAAQARYVFDTRAEITGSDEIITLRLLSLDTKEEERLNDVLVTGSLPANEDDLLVNPTFFTANGMSVGDPVSVFHNGKEYVYNVCGTAISPEYVYITKSEIEILPDESGFGIGYVTASSMATLANSAGVANDVVFTLAEGAAFDGVKTALEDALAPYGLKELIPLKDQMSYAFLDLELSGVQSMSAAMPMVFMMMAVVVLYLMMKRVIEQDRAQIGTLKAFGYSNGQILRHYMLYGGVTGLVGGAVGYACGLLLSSFYLSMFLRFFLLPGIAAEFDPAYLARAMLLAVGSGLSGAFMGAFKTLGLNPAEAMRPESPKPVKTDIIGKIGALRYVLTSRGSMALRGIIRNPVRSGFVVIGVMFSYGLLSIAGSFDSLIDKMIFGQFENIQLYDVKITLKQPLAYAEAVESAYAVGHVTRAEGLMEVPVELKNRHIREGAVIMGVPKDAALYKVCDTNTGVSYPPPTEGVILSSGLADQLNAKAGSTLLISSLFSEEDVAMVVTRVVEQNLGSGCYMELGALARLFNQPETATAVALDTDDLAYVKETLKTGANAYSIDDKESTLKKYQAMMAPYASIYFILQALGALVAFAIIYNTSTISLSERKREYATLRVLGLTVNEVCEILSFEYWTLSVAAMALGVPFTLLLNDALNLMMDTSMYSMPSTLPLSAFATGVSGCGLAILFSNYSARKKIARFDMVEVLKERE